MSTTHRVARYGFLLFVAKTVIVVAAVAFTYATSGSQASAPVSPFLQHGAVAPAPGWLTAAEAPCGAALICDKAAPATTIYRGDYLSVTY